MRKKFFISVAVFSALIVDAQILKVDSIERVAIPESETTEQVVGISPKGDFLLLSSQSQEGLVRFDLSKKALTVISDAPSAGFNACISQDGSKILFQEMSVADEGRVIKHGVKSLDVKKQKVTQLISPKENFSSLSLSGDVVVGMSAGQKIDAKTIKGKSATVKKPVLNNDDLKIWLTVDGKTRKIAPQGDDFAYIWESLSPDMTKILYVNEAGCFVTDLNGMILANLGELRAPKWIDDSTVVGMLDHDDGTVVTSSEIVVKTLSGGVQILTDSSLTGMWPQVAEGKIAFSNPKGEIYIINYKK